MNDTQLRIQAYLDNELSPGEARKLAAMLTSDREAQQLFGELRATKEALRANEPEVKLQESRDFYWSQIQRRIAAAKPEPVRTPAPWWMRIIAPVLGTAALFALLAVVSNPGSRVVRTERETIASGSTSPLHGEIEDVADDMSSVTFRSEEHGVTVVWLTSRE
jgi:anti-sigma factor RsiW